jgi:cytochrome c
MGADPAAGKAVFTSQCGVCHSVVPDKNGVGPSLFGLVGRKSGSVLGFHYSAANHAANIVWDEQTLDPYLKSPMTTIPGTTMGYAGVKDDQKRADLIAYLATLK